MSRWSHRICERCWFDGPGRSQDGIPYQMRDPEIGSCCVCGKPTMLGLYFREDPMTLLCRGVGLEHEE